MPLESLYGGYVAQQTSLALEVTPKSTDLLMGLPFYHEDNLFGHWNLRRPFPRPSAASASASPARTPVAPASASRSTSTSRPRRRTGRRTGTTGCRENGLRGAGGLRIGG